MRVGVVGGGQIQHAVVEQRRGLDVRVEHRPRCGLRPFSTDDGALERRVQPARPREREVLHVALVDLIERAVMTARVVAVERRPGVGRRLEDLRRVEAGALTARRLRGGTLTAGHSDTQRNTDTSMQRSTCERAQRVSHRLASRSRRAGGPGPPSPRLRRATFARISGEGWSGGWDLRRREPGALTGAPRWRSGSSEAQCKASARVI